MGGVVQFYQLRPKNGRIGFRNMEGFGTSFGTACRRRRGAGDGRPEIDQFRAIARTYKTSGKLMLCELPI